MHDYLKAKHNIEPISEDPWIKGFTGGSDGHAGLFIGQTCTTAVCSSKKELLEHIKNKKSLCEGRYNDYKSFAFSIYKIFCDYSRANHNKFGDSITEMIHNTLFTSNSTKFREWLTRRKIRKGKTDFSYQAVMNGYDRVFFTGRIPNEKLLKLYTCSDIFAFPSTTDTFGMVVLESLACEPAGNKIGLKRLHAQPWAVLSIKAVEELESARRQNRPVSKVFA